MNLVDMIGLKFDDFYFNEGGIKFRRKKTANKVKMETIIPRTTWTDRILSILGITAKRGEYIFPNLHREGKSDYDVQHFAAGTTNDHIRKAAKKLGIDKDVTMTVARHSFATIATKNRMPANLIEFAMAHSNGGVSSHYIGSWNVAEMKEDFERLLPAI